MTSLLPHPKHRPPPWLKWIALFLVGVFTQFLVALYRPMPLLGQTPPGTSACALITNPLTPEEDQYARSAWQYFVDNYQPATGFANAAGAYPSGTLWDMGNYLTALNAARWLNFVSPDEFDYYLNQFLTTLGQLRLFDNALPNKVYNTATGELVDYGNNPVEQGLGWSALDIGRLLAAFHMIRTCHPQYNDWLTGIVDSWEIERSLQNGQLYGAVRLPDGSILPVQEGRLGYEEYAARGYQLWGFEAPVALELQPFEMVDIYGISIPVDLRDYQTTNANNYVVSESYILDGIEFGLEGDLADYAARVLEVQKRRYEQTGKLTAVSEDNIDQPPNFLYNTVYANGVPWAVITDTNDPYPQFRTLSTKAAFGWHYLYPSNAYAQQVFDAVKDLRNPEGGGYFAGIYEESQEVNEILTGNTNGLIMEILYFKARGNRPLIRDGGLAPAPMTPAVDPAAPGPAAPAPDAAPSPVPSSPAAPSAGPTSAAPGTATVTPIAAVGAPQPSACSTLAQPLPLPERRYAEAAWQYFQSNHQSSGLVNDRSDLNGATPWGMGDYLVALHAARSLQVINARLFDQRVRHLLAALQALPLAAGELPGRSYSTLSLQPVDYGTNPSTGGTGWSSLDAGRLLAALHMLKACHPEYADAVDDLPLTWSYLRVLQDGQLASASVMLTDQGRSQLRVYPETRLGYEEYAARAFQLWGFDADRSAVGGSYQTVQVEGQPIPVQRQRPNAASAPRPYTVSPPFLLYGLEFGLDPQMRSLVQPMVAAEAARYQRTGRFTASGTTLLSRSPYIVHSTIVAADQPWATVTPDGQTNTGDRFVSTATAFAYQALFPDETYTSQLRQTVTDLYNPLLGFYEGFNEVTGQKVSGFSSSTNSLILEALLYGAAGRSPLVYPTPNLRSAWWRSVEQGNSGRGLPAQPRPQAHRQTHGSGTYWISGTGPARPPDQSQAQPPDQSTAAAPLPSAAVPEPPLPPPTAVPALPPVPSAVESPPAAAASPRPPATTPAPASFISRSILSPPVAESTPLLPLSEADRIAAERAWNYFERNWNPRTGMVNAVEGMAWTTLWDQGSAIIGICAAQQLGLVSDQLFQQRMDTLLRTLSTLPLTSTGLPNKAYSTASGSMRSLTNRADPQGRSGWSALDTARFLLALHVLRSHYPEYGDRIQQIVRRWDTAKLVQNGWLYGAVPVRGSQLQTVQEGRFGYEQYAANSLKLWQLDATQALTAPPLTTVEVDGIEFQIDQRNLSNSGASNYLTNDPYLLWGMELGWPETIQPQVQNLLQVQAQRYERTGILTAVNEDSLDRPPYFLYYSIYANGQPWTPITVRGAAHPDLRFLSTKAAFAWGALMPDHAYAQTLRAFVQNLADPQRGYLSGRFENSRLGVNRSIDVNTNGIVLESLLYQARGQQPLAF